MAADKYKSDPGWEYLRQSEEKMVANQANAAKKFDAKKSVWIPDIVEGFIAAEIKSSKGDVLVVVTAKGNEKTLNKDETQQMNPPKFEMVEDMADLTFLNEASVLHNLRKRYDNNMIYTYSGLFCVVINPYKRFPIYSENVCKMYIGKRRNEMPPHIFAVCDEAYRSMVNDHENQSMLITGESGAGKTENTKKVISYFAVIGSSSLKKKRVTSPNPSSKLEATLEEQIVRTNPVLEAFGNAKTVRNNNSSRFGKFIRVHFNNAGRLAGGDIEHYLLEKSRVIRQAPGERSYHIFYQILSDAIVGLKKRLFLERPVKDYHFVAQAEVTIDGLDDKEEMFVTDESFDIMKFTETEKSDLFALTAAILHMGEMKFKQRPREEQAEVDDMREGELACKLLKVDIEKFVGAFLKPRVKVGSEWVNKGQNLEQVQFAVGAVAKALYARMFHWLIKRCNLTLDAKDLSRDLCIGVLDIAGFEIFDLNSFEQMWINFVNERLQQFFNHHMFVLEQEEYQREGIRWEYIDFGLDLQACIELIEKPLGIISMLDEECIVPKANDVTLAQKLNDQHLGKHPNFQKPKPPKGKQAEAHFAIIHYAGTVRYNVKFWLEKNKDPLNDSVVAVLKGNKQMQLLSAIWEDFQTQEDISANESRGKVYKTKKKSKSSSFMTVSMIYRESLNNLINMLHQTHPHFIRCIIPNEQKKSGIIEANLVLNQLTCNGVLEGIRICRKGYPNRVNYSDFKQRYAILAADQALEKEPKVAGEKMCAAMEKHGQLKTEQFQCGKTKVFFRAGVLAYLEELRDEALASIIVKLQRQCRFYLAQMEFKRLVNQQVGIKIIQRNVRKWCNLRTWHWFKVYSRVKPLIKDLKKDEEFENMQKRCKELESDFLREEKLRKEAELKQAKLVEEKLQLNLILEQERESIAESEERSAKLMAQKSDLEKQLNDMHDDLSDQQDKFAGLNKLRKKLELDNDGLKKQLSEQDMVVRKHESDKQSKEMQIRSLQDEIGTLDDTIAKLNKERKHHDEINRKLMDDLHAEEDKLNQLSKTKNKLEQSLDHAEDALERERRTRQDMEKQKRKTEGELKVAQENLEELGRQKIDVENALKKKESELASISSRLEDEQSLVARLQRQIKELLGRVQELEEELDAERSARSKIEKARGEMQVEIEELSDRLDEAGGATQAHVEMNKKREAELTRLRRDLEESNLQNELAVQALRKKHADAVAELADQMDVLHKSRAKLEKEKLQGQREVETLQNSMDYEVKQRQNLERMVKQLETQLVETQMKGDEQTRQIQELQAWKNRSITENGDLGRQLEDAENQINALGRVKSQLLQQVEEMKRQMDQEARDRQSLVAQANGWHVECQQLRDQLEEEQESKSELQRLLSKAHAETAQWRAKFEGEGVNRAEELEEARRKILAKAQEVQQQLENANVKVASLEKARHRTQQELEDAQLDAERAHALAAGLEKKQKVFDKLVEEWKQKCDSLAAELDASQRETRNTSTEAFRLRAALDETNEQLESLRRENKNVSQELKDLTDQMSEGGKSVHELAKAKRRLELEKEELQLALEDAESALEAEESKVLRAQVEISQIRTEIEKRIAEKEEEFENTRKNHQRALDSLQTSYETESKAKVELIKTKKKLESDIGELEIALDHANKANVDAQKNLKRYQESIRELQQQIDDEQHAREALHDQMQLAERRAQMLQQEKEELAVALEQADRHRLKSELEGQEAKDTLASLEIVNATIGAAKRKLENQVMQLQSELDQAINDLKVSDDLGKKVSMDAVRFAEELRAEQDHALSLERQRKAMEQQLKELQQRLDEAENVAMKGGKKLLSKLEQRTRELENELEAEARRHSDTQKQLRNKDRRVRELQFQIEEDKKASERMYDVVEKLQAKIKTFKRQNEEVEQVATLNLTKYKQIQHMLEDAEERADVAENSLAKMRAKSRSSANVRGVLAGGRSTILHSMSSAALFSHSNHHGGPLLLNGGGVLNTSSNNLMTRSITEE